MFYGFIAGLTGGAIGLGGATILVPVWLNMGVDKDVATASSAPLIMISSFCSFFISALSDAYTLPKFLEFFILSFFSSWIVKAIISFIAARYHMKSVVYILLMFTMIASLLTLLPF
jgi:uncharacterized membrane protein YfcA